MKANPINDMNNKNIQIRPDGRVLHDMYLVQVKTPAESKYPLDYYKILATTPGTEAFRPLSESECGYIKKN
jgi:branched-chain amino acid transport system substrate-binding protein